MGCPTIEYGGFLFFCGGIRMPVPRLSFNNYAAYTKYGTTFTNDVSGTHLCRASLQSKHQAYSPRNTYRSCTPFYSVPELHFNKKVQLGMKEESSILDHPRLILGSSLKQNKSYKISADKIEEYPSHDSDRGLGHKSESTTVVHDKEIQRRRKIGLANKGKTPWNKGRKHSQETRDRIKQRTIEAMRDPKVRKKMSEYPRSHSALSKARIAATMRRKWDDRLKQRRSQERCYLMWARTIAEAAKIGDGRDQQELEWDSYEKLQVDIILQHLEQKSEKARAKEVQKRLRAERIARARMEKLAILSQQRREKEEKARARKLKALARKKLEDERKRLALSNCLKVRLTKAKFHCRTQPVDVQNLEGTVVEPQPVLDEWDIDRIKFEKMRKRVTLADQIQALKNQNADSDAMEAMETVSYDTCFDVKE